MIISPKKHAMTNMMASWVPTYFFSLLPGFVALKAIITVRVLANTHEREIVNTIPKVTCWRRQHICVGRPMNNKVQRKHNMREMRRRQLRYWLLAFTIGVSRYFLNISRITAVVMDNISEMEDKVAPSWSS
ncbi:hypothetical protein XELAEV_18028359mg [Xenopus laevis]|uniref:Uncharacterized protein n=1 Tax=Xenopus laevis TaxID=8355 RepID=A0A974CZQ3_XENLA|nr:hypothetical protein XELAEV_18028359mg [Xenopus laevis]